MQNKLVPLKECPIGLFLKENTLCVKTEYGLDAYIVSSGEYFWGGAKTKEERANVLVLPISDEIVETLETGVIANGVIVPPCKVGDTIYRTAIEYGEVWEWDIVEIQIKLDEFVFIDDSENIFLETDIGKTVFLTKDQAEQKLKELSENA